MHKSMCQPGAVVVLIAATLAACIPPNAQHALTVVASPAGSGNVIVDPIKPVYPAGSIVAIEAVPAEGWRFLRWDAPGVNTTQPAVEIIMFRNVTATALFVPFDATVQPIVRDSGFEQGPLSTAWAQSSTNFDTLICSLDTCNTVNGIGPHAGQHWVAFGTAPDGVPETASISQLIGMPANAPVFLQFFLAMPAAEASFIFQVLLDDTLVYETSEDQQAHFESYKAVSLDISQFAGTDPKVLRFNYQNAVTGDKRIHLFLDNVVLLAQGG